MKFEIKTGTSPLDFIRRIGYRPISGNAKEYSAVKSMGGGEYPRFHIYFSASGEPGYFFVNLHLDQKKPTYSGSHAHSGEYDGDLVSREFERIKSLFPN